MRRYVIRIAIFGLLGPAATHLGFYLLVRHAERWWWPQPAIYLVELLPFLLCAVIDGALKDARAWERAVVAGISALVASSLALAIVFGGFGAWTFGLAAPLAAVACSILATGTDVPDSTDPIDRL
ncbi:hypothetical protein SAMN05192541_12158 [Bradyrhizobium arachidis]|uniref:Uncharacterized protein n=1 Tax=Bradyrhizobium arachidis TaxID=858423 RepID=A0AAE7TL96_9BRAD|nr:hypothetical protein WN72_40940 [Bradyrhizobium arachidis]SFV14251.1 hypothetical protein SAMN05192541_12158 [Bradyrhizobium arachidis]